MSTNNKHGSNVDGSDVLESRLSSTSPLPDDALMSQHEWELQEQALQAERMGLAAPTSNEIELAAYRHVARALRTEHPGRLPSNFAHDMARLTARLPRKVALDLRCEDWLLRGLAIAMTVAGVTGVMLYGPDAITALRSMPGGAGAGAWTATAAACLLLSWGAQGLPTWLQRHS